MKKTTLLFTFLTALISISCQSINKSAPEVVKTAFSTKFPEVKEVKWEKENDTEWEAEFKLKDKEYSANFSTDGTWLETENEIEITDLPIEVTGMLNSQYSDYEIEEIEAMSNINGYFYEIELEKGETEIELVINTKGEVIESKTESDND